MQRIVGPFTDPPPVRTLGMMNVPAEKARDEISQRLGRPEAKLGHKLVSHFPDVVPAMLTFSMLLL